MDYVLCTVNNVKRCYMMYVIHVSGRLNICICNIYTMFMMYIAIIINIKYFHIIILEEFILTALACVCLYLFPVMFFSEIQLRKCLILQKCLCSSQIINNEKNKPACINICMLSF